MSEDRDITVEERRKQFREMSKRILERVPDTLKEMEELFVRKNTDYGDSFSADGPIGVVIRIGDKIRRLKSISKNKITLVEDETTKDTLKDAASYSIMALMLLEEEEEYCDSFMSTPIVVQCLRKKGHIGFHNNSKEKCTWANELDNTNREKEKELIK